MKFTKLILTICMIASIQFFAKAEKTSLIASNSDSNTIHKIMAEIASLDEEHCEVPCGIYGDSLRIALISEHIRTVEKACNQINELSSAATPNYNQIVRWVVNKEKHAEEIQEIVSQYFLHQRIKLTDNSDKKKYKKYHMHLEALHKISVLAMKSKQGTDLEVIAKLKAAVEDFESMYFHKH